MIMANDHHSRRDPFVDLGPAYEILDILKQDRDHAVKINTAEMDKVRDRMEEIRRHPKQSKDSFNQETLTGSFLEAIGIKKRMTAGMKIIAANLEEIDEREAKERLTKKPSSPAMMASPVSDSPNPAIDGVKSKTTTKPSKPQKRARTVRG